MKLGIMGDLGKSLFFSFFLSMTVAAVKDRQDLGPEIVNSEVCVFSNGYLESEWNQKLDDANSANECAVQVKSENPSAIGVTWYSSGSNKCYAEFGTPAEIVVDDGYKACLFPVRTCTTDADCENHKVCNDHDNDPETTSVCACGDADNGATDKDGDGCNYYTKDRTACGKYDDDDFFSNQMCCACGGGASEKCSKDAIGGTPGDGDGTQGNCDSLQYCYNDQHCATQCSKDPVNGSPGDGTGNTKGNCPFVGTVCFPDGKCRSQECLRVYEGVSSIPINNSVTINSDYYPGGHYIEDGGEDYYDYGNFIGVPAFTENYVTYLENCNVGLVDGSLYSMAMNNSAISSTMFLDYQHSSISIDGEFGWVSDATTGFYQFNQWKGFWKISQYYNDDYLGNIHHLWVTNSPIAEHVSNLHDMKALSHTDYDVDLVVGLKGYHVVYNMWITNMAIATPDDVIKQLVEAVADALDTTS